MAIKSLAIKYRPTTFDDVVEQDTIKAILKQQLESNTIKHAYLFVGGAGTGKTTCARIFANEINHHQGNPIEQDAASNNSVDDARVLIQQAQTQPLDSEFKVFIIDECHMITNAAWNALLKLIEEPPAKAIFIFCTTDPQKIPKTIMSRVQRYDFQRISQKGIFDRLHYIALEEFYTVKNITIDHDAIEYIAKIADGGMRDAITMMDKCFSFNQDLTMENVVKALGLTDYDIMFRLNTAIVENNGSDIIDIVESIYSSGKDLKVFIRNYMQFLLDVCKYYMLGDFKYIQIPNIYKDELDSNGDYEKDRLRDLLPKIMKLNTDLKWDNSPKYMTEAVLLLEVENGTDS